MSCPQTQDVKIPILVATELGRVHDSSGYFAHIQAAREIEDVIHKPLNARRSGLKVWISETELLARAMRNTFLECLNDKNEGKDCTSAHEKMNSVDTFITTAKGGIYPRQFERPEVTIIRPGLREKFELEIRAGNIDSGFKERNLGHDFNTASGYERSKRVTKMIWTNYISEFTNLKRTLEIPPIPQFLMDNLDVTFYSPLPSRKRTKKDYFEELWDTAFLTSKRYCPYKPSSPDCQRAPDTEPK